MDDDHSKGSQQEHSEHVDIGEQQLRVLGLQVGSR